MPLSSPLGIEPGQANRRAACKVALTPPLSGSRAKPEGAFSLPFVPRLGQGCLRQRSPLGRKQSQFSSLPDALNQRLQRRRRPRSSQRAQAPLASRSRRSRSVSSSDKVIAAPAASPAVTPGGPPAPAEAGRRPARHAPARSVMTPPPPPARARRAGGRDRPQRRACNDHRGGRPRPRSRTPTDLRPPVRCAARDHP